MIGGHAQKESIVAFRFVLFNFSGSFLGDGIEPTIMSKTGDLAVTLYNNFSRSYC